MIFYLLFKYKGIENNQFIQLKLCQINFDLNVNNRIALL